MKTTIRFFSLMLSITMLFGIVTTFSGCRSRTDNEPTTEETTTEAINVEDPVSIEIETTTEPSAENSAEQHTTNKSVEGTTKRKSEPTTVKSNKQGSTTKEHTEATTKKTVSTTKKQETTTKKATSQTASYSCGCKNHNCTSAEEHSFLVSLEDKGCPICGSHSCKSFYALDEWGQQCYDISKCPKYSEKNDPCIYCEHCGKKCGVGDNGTCVRFTVDTVCPICGKTVKAKTCHSH